MRKRPVQERFWEKVHKSTDPSDCWTWLAGRNHWGYGTFGINRHSFLAHRVAWEMKNGPIPLGVCVLHRCDNRPCLNPDHLFLGTQTENVRDMDEKGRRKPPRGERNASSRLKASDIPEIRLLYGKLSGPKTGERFGVSSSTIYKVWHGEKWQWVNDEVTT
jgi:hypothetical protein